MTAPQPVTVMRVRRTGGQWFSYLLAGIVSSFAVAWLLMLIFGAATPWHLGYWRALLVLIGVRLLQTGSGWLNWTHPQRGGTR